MSIDPVSTPSDEYLDDYIDDDELDFENDNEDFFDADEDDFLLNSEEQLEGDDVANLKKHYYPYFRDSNGSFDGDY